jgi:acyl-CoA thioester hydrolase
MGLLEPDQRLAGKIESFWVAVTSSATGACMTESSRPLPEPRSAYRVLRPISTRWSDNDVYGHVNNVVYYSWFDTAVNGHLIEQGVLDIHAGDLIGLVVQTQCHYFSPLAYPQAVLAGVRVGHLGTSSVRYEVALFAADAAPDAPCAARGHFVHVYVDRHTRRPRPLPPPFLAVLEKLR